MDEPEQPGTGEEPTAGDQPRTVDAVATFAGPGPEPGRPPRMVALAVTAGAGLVLTQGLFVLFSLIEGLAIERAQTGNVHSDLLHRIGIAFSTSVNIASGLALLVAVALLSAPAVTTAYRAAMRGLRTASLIAVQVVAAIIAIGTILGVRWTLHATQAQGQKVTAPQRWELAAYVAGTLGTAIVAFLAALAALPGSGDTADT
jgi:hypothetical protein